MREYCMFSCCKVVDVVKQAKVASHQAKVASQAGLAKAKTKMGEARTKMGVRSQQ